MTAPPVPHVCKYNHRPDKLCVKCGRRETMTTPSTPPDVLALVKRGRLVFVGESNPYGDEGFALFYLPRHASGNRLREHLGLSDDDYEAIARVNLVPGRWSMPKGREAAKRLCELFEVVVCLGAKVRAAFAGPPPFEREARGATTLVTLPHPSGLNRAWDAPDARSRARTLMRRVAPELPWGEP